jgi:hypothetical protein
MAPLNQLTAESAADIAWIVALWKKVHGGDPGPDGETEVKVTETTAILGSLFLTSLAETTATTRLSESEMTAGLAQVGLVRRDHHEFCRAGSTDLCVSLADRSEIESLEGEGAAIISETGTTICFCVNRLVLEPSPVPVKLP